MSDVMGDNYTIHNAGGPPSSFLSAGAWKGKVRVQTDMYECASLAAGSTIKVAAIPANAVFLGLSNISADALGSGVTLSVGIDGTAAKFLAAAAFNTANQQKFCNVVDGQHYNPSEGYDVIITTAGATAGGTIKSETCYSQE